jgi:hypothetical protein
MDEFSYLSIYQDMFQCDAHSSGNININLQIFRYKFILCGPLKHPLRYFVFNNHSIKLVFDINASADLQSVLICPLKSKLIIHDLAYFFPEYSLICII